MSHRSQEYADTGYGPIDVEHREISLALNELVDTVAGNRLDDARDALYAATALVVRHFAHEERLMAEFAYPAKPNHQRAHESFVVDIGKHTRDLDASGLTPELRRWVLGRLLDWFRFHVMAYDVALGHFLLAQMPAERRAARGA